MDVCLLWVLSSRGLCVGLITRPEESYRLWCVIVCDLETSWMRRSSTTGGYRAKKQKHHQMEISSNSFPLASRQPYLFDIYLLLYVQFWTPDDGRKDRPKHVQCYAKVNNLRNWCTWLVLLWEYITMHGPMNVKFLICKTSSHCQQDVVVTGTENLGYVLLLCMV
jgi:hypothetical protein